MSVNEILPADLLDSVMTKLDLEDYLNFRLTCKYVYMLQSKSNIEKRYMDIVSKDKCELYMLIKNVKIFIAVLKFVSIYCNEVLFRFHKDKVKIYEMSYDKRCLVQVTFESTFFDQYKIKGDSLQIGTDLQLLVEYLDKKIVKKAKLISLVKKEKVTLRTLINNKNYMKLKLNVPNYDLDCMNYKVDISFDALLCIDRIELLEAMPKKLLDKYQTIKIKVNNDIGTIILSKSDEYMSSIIDDDILGPLVLDNSSFNSYNFEENLPDINILTTKVEKHFTPSSSVELYVSDFRKIRDLLSYDFKITFYVKDDYPLVIQLKSDNGVQILYCMSPL